MRWWQFYGHKLFKRIVTHLGYNAGGVNHMKESLYARTLIMYGPFIQCRVKGRNLLMLKNFDHVHAHITTHLGSLWCRSGINDIVNIWIMFK